MDFGHVLLFTLLAGAAAPAGGVLAAIERLRPGEVRQDLLHGMVAFGGGVLIAAVALVLVPGGVHGLRIVTVAAAFSGGAVVFLLIDRAIEMRGARAGQFMSLVMDFVPESIGLGAAFAVGGEAGPLLALLIGLQNLPEGFNTFRELHASGLTRRRILTVLTALAFVGPLAGLLGYYVLSHYARAVPIVFLFAAGGIVYLVFHDIAPLAHREGHWVPSLGAVLGFLAGLLGSLALGA